MPHVSGDGDDLASSDEIKVFKDEGEDEKKLSDNLTDDKSSLVTEGETEKSQLDLPGHSYSTNKNAHVSRSDASPSAGKSFEPLPHGIGYVVGSPYAHANGSLGPMSKNVGMVAPQQRHPASPLPFMVYNTDAFAQPPPAHMGIPSVHIDPKTGIPLMAAAFQQFTWNLEHQGIPRPPMYSLPPPGQYPHLFSPDFASQLQWPLLARHSPSMYPMPSAGFRGSYPSTLPGVSSPPGLPRFAPPSLIAPHPGMPSHPGFSHHAIITPGPKQEVSPHQENNRLNSAAAFHLDQKPPIGKSGNEGGGVVSNLNNHGGGNGNVSPPSNNNNSNNHHHGHHHSSNHHHQNHHHHHNHPGVRAPSSASSNSNNHHQYGGGNEKKAPKNTNHIKKPLNAFMLYMKEMRAKVVAECTLKESAAINQILGRRWHSLSREEQAKYYEMARKERQLHMQLYPGWSARDNYAQNCQNSDQLLRRPTRKKLKRTDPKAADGNNPKKCRARYGLDKQSSWCKPCRRKKKCIRYMDMGEHSQEENLGSVESMGAPTPDSKSTLDDDDHSSSIGGGSDGDLAHTSSELSLSSPPMSVPSDIVDQKPVLSETGAILRHQQYQLHNFHPSSTLSAQIRNHQNLVSSVTAAAVAASAASTMCSSSSPLHISHPLSVHHLSQSHTGISLRENHNCDMESNLPTPPSTDSSTTNTAPQMLTVT